MAISMAPQVSTLNLGMADRMIGRLVNMDVNGDHPQAQQDLAGDTFHALYKGVDARQQIPNERLVNHNLLEWAKSTAAWPDLQAQARGNIASSLLGGEMLWRTMTTDEAMQEALKRQQKAEQKQQEAEQAQREADMQQAVQPGSQQAQAAAQRAQQAQQAANQVAQQAAAYAKQIGGNNLNKGVMAQAVRKATEKAKQVNNLFTGWGHGPGSPIAQDPKQAMAFMNAHTPKIARIANLAGRMRSIGADARRQQVVIGSTPAGYEYTQDISRIIASELALLSSQAHPALRAIKLAQYGNGGLIGRKQEAVQNEAGPFVFGCDVSGSMHGDREENAKGVGLGMAQIAHAEQRPYRLFSFSSGHDAVIRCSSEDSWPQHIKWAGDTIHGGTDFNLALTTAIDDLRLMGDAGLNPDIAISSDGEAMLDDATIALWRQYKAESGARLLYIPVAEGYGSFEQIADLVIRVDDLMSDDIARQVATWMR